ncbi:hypothetical protein Pfo_002780 [Paulownia fortunei]|nr:hypothetical protein Pfo_002780 [Paulownia fortunei]
MSRNYDNWERLVKATLLREELRRIGREDSLSSSSSSSEFTWSFRESNSPLLNSSSNLGISFSYQQIALATHLFSDQNLIKRGHSGDLFMGFFPQLSEPVVVKRIRIRLQVVNSEALSSELGFFSWNSHSRFVHLLGHCSEADKEKFLVYRYLPKRDLSNSLFNKADRDDDSWPSLDWITRLKIARGVAEGLAFLHHECNPPLVHGDVQASSILLDHNFEVRLGSLSQVSAQVKDPGIQKNKVTFTWRSKKGTSGKPNATCTYDVYCFGKVLLELVTGKLGISSSPDGTMKEWLETTLPYISIYDKELVTNIVDPSLIIDEDLLEEVWAMAIVARSCLNPKPSMRPIMRYVLKALENPLKVVREENTSSERLRTMSSGRVLER